MLVHHNYILSNHVWLSQLGLEPVLYLQIVTHCTDLVGRISVVRVKVIAEHNIICLGRNNDGLEKISTCP